MHDARQHQPDTRSGRVVGRLRGRGRVALGAALLVLLGGAACSLDGLLHRDELPKDVSDPALTQTPDGARAAYHGTLTQFRAAFSDAGNSFVPLTGLLSDELMVFSSTVDGTPVDQRQMSSGIVLGDQVGLQYSALQKMRGQAGQAIGLLTRYLPDQPALVGHLYALQGYAEIFLAEFFCSGVPLSTIDYAGTFTYQPGSNTEAVFTHAAALFDTALALAGDSVQFGDLARVGKARALLGLGDYAEAATATAPVADGYRYNVNYTADSVLNGAGGYVTSRNFTKELSLTVPDREGVNGLNWRTSGDPRTAVTAITPIGSSTFYRPNKYDTLGSSPIVLASGVEARLIGAEAALKQGHPDDGAWLTTLNALRTDNTFDITTTSPPDTLWHAGSGGVAGLKPLADPVTDTARVSLLFRERAFWLFLTGHRQGDLRRLIRQYRRNQSDLYPIGPYLGSVFPYGPDVTVPVPVEESANPLYTGCFSRGA